MPTPTTSTRRRTSTRSPAATSPSSTVELHPEIYGTGRTAPAEEVVQDYHGHNILRSDSTVAFDSEGEDRIVSTLTEDSFTCPHCSSRRLTSGQLRVRISSTSNTAQTWCSSCVEDDTWRCHRCACTVSDDTAALYASGDSERSRPLCYDCYRRAAPTESGIFGRLLNYSNKDVGKIPPKDGSSMLYGWEVEVHVAENENVDAMIRLLHEKVGGGYYVTKSDGSIGHGFEIVTRPDAMYVHREEWARILEAIADTPKLRDSLRSWNAPRQCCGIHCHIDKAQLSALALAKMNMWLNHPANRSFIEQIAGRGSGSFTSFSDSVTLKDGRALKAGTSPARYVALNVGKSTAEMRIFRGTLNPDRLFRNMDFVEATTEWTSLAACAIRDVLSVGRFAAFVRDHKSFYPFLAEALDEWKIESAPPTKA